MDKSTTETAAQLSSTVTLRLAEGFKLGLELSKSNCGRRLDVVNVQISGAVHAWNLQCRDPSRMILPTDSIVLINNQCTAEAMLTECHESRLLRLTVLRIADSAFRVPTQALSWIGLPWATFVATPPSFTVPPGTWQEFPAQESEEVTFCCYLSEDDASTVSGDWPSSEDGASHDETELRPIAFHVTEDARRLVGKKTRVVKTVDTVAGKFAVMMLPSETFPGQGGRSFGASEGHGRLEVKCCCENLAGAGRLVQVSVGSSSSSHFSHVFARDGLMCRVPGDWDFLGAAENGIIRVTLYLLTN
jgi:hypothetical protein